MNCFVCSEYLNGDDQFIQSHLNQCLDRQGSSSSTPRASTASLHSLSQNYTASNSIPSQEDADLALALSLAQQQSSPSRDRQLALSLAQQENQSISRNSSDSTLCCPCCQVYWGEIGLSPLSDDSNETEQQRRRHTERCLEARTKSGVEGGHGEWEIDDEGDDSSGTGIGIGVSGWAAEEAGGTKWNGGIGTKFEVTGTPHLLPLIRQALQKSHLSPHGRTQTAYLVSNNTLHIGTKFNDWGWGCGYKNLQMIFSSLRHLPQYKSHLRSLLGSSTSEGETPIPIPTIQELQKMIEYAWSLGFDPPGAAHFGGKLRGSRKWIGTTEVYTALTFLGIRAKMVDFPKVTKGDLRGREGDDVATHQTLIKWIISYFSTPSSSSSRSSSSSASPPPSTSPKNAYTALLSSSSTSHSVKTSSKTTKQPLYLQHQGHSRTIVGIERMKGSGNGGEGTGDEWLLLFDPGRPISNDLKTLATSATAPTFSSSSDSASQEPLSKRFKPNGFGRLSSNKQSSSATDWKFGDVLKGFRVNMKDLKKRDEYQILYVEEDGAPLGEMERMKRRKVISQAAK